MASIRTGDRPHLLSDTRGGLSTWVVLLFGMPVIGSLLITGAYLEKAFDRRHEVNQEARACATGFALTLAPAGECIIEGPRPAVDAELRAAAGGQFEVVATTLPFLSAVLELSLHGEQFATSAHREVEGTRIPLFERFQDREVGRGYSTFVRTRTREAELEPTYLATCELLGTPAWCK